MTWLLDGNVLVALCMANHTHHASAHEWYASDCIQKFATCCVTQGTLLRVHMATAEDPTAAAAWNTLKRISKHPSHEFWDADLDYNDVSCKMLQGPKQITDAWLAELARKRGARLATFDAALHLLHGDVAEKIPFL